MNRIFIALWPDRSTAAAIEQTIARWAWPLDCRRYAPADLHITLHFIGGVTSERIDEVRDALHVPFEPFTVRLDTPQHWPGGLAVLCPGAIPDALSTLHQRLGQPLREHHLPVSARVLAPHVTLARRCNRIEMPAVCPPIAWHVREYALVLSTGDVRQRYVLLQTYDACRVDGPQSGDTQTEASRH